MGHKDDLRKILVDKRQELQDRIKDVEESLASLDEVAWCPEVVIRKADGEIGFPKYYLGHKETVYVEVYMPYFSTPGFVASPKTYSMNEFKEAFLEFTTKTRVLFPRSK